jgi:NADPH-dependent 7-cyano-7-deazaguanine reductase QueF-like protein
MDLTPVGRFMKRHRIAIKELSLIVAGSVLALYYGYEVDMFANEGPVAVHERAIELDEALLIEALVSLVLFIFCVRLYLAQKHEVARRIAAEARVLDHHKVRRGSRTFLALKLGQKKQKRFSPAKQNDAPSEERGARRRSLLRRLRRSTQRWGTLIDQLRVRVAQAV